jgi:proteasome accessory factor A
MSVHRVMGVETEYGVFAPHRPDADTAQLSRTVLDAYAATLAEAGTAEPVRWDYSGESADTGGDLNPSWVARLTEQEQVFYRGNSLVLTNGARLYVDHGHPEHAGPEVTTPLDVVAYDAAGDAMMARAVARIAQRNPDFPTGSGHQVLVYKNNVDGKGSAYGTHENYLVERRVPFDDLTEALLPFLVSRVVLCGAGRVGIGARSEHPGFQCSQRADYVETEVGLQTTERRPIVNTRDEPHADPSRWRRLHVIAGDATSAQGSTLLKTGTTALLLWVLERIGLAGQWAALRLADPVAAVRTISRDPSLRAVVPLADGRRLRALDIQRAYLDVVDRELARNNDFRDDADAAQTALVTGLWAQTLDRLDSDLWSAADTVEWVARHLVLRGLRERAGVGWDDPRLAAADLQWSDVRPRGIAATMTAQGRLRRFVDEHRVADAETNPPTQTRAWLRGESIRRLRGRVFAASWQSLVLDTGAARLVRLPMPQPEGYGLAEAGAALQAACGGTAPATPAQTADPTALIAALTGHPEPPVHSADPA